MVALAVPVDTCAALLNVDEAALRTSLDRGEIRGVRVGEEWRVSLFEIARLLGTTVQELLEYVEDFGLAQAIQEVEGDETYVPAEGRRLYEGYVRGTSE
jgi:hypothetical protein